MWRRPYVILALVALLPGATPARAFLWPWQYHISHHHHRRAQRLAPPAPSAPMEISNCDQIKEAVKALDKERLDRALISATHHQRQIINRCLGIP